MANYDGTITFDQWPTMPEVTARTGMSQRTIYRHVEEGRLRKAERPIPGRRPLPVFHPEDVENLMAMIPQVLPVSSQELSLPHSAAVAKPVTVTAKPLAHSDGMISIPLSLNELRHKVYLETDEAVRYSGLNEDYLATLAKAGKIVRITSMRPYRYRRVDLEAL